MVQRTISKKMWRGVSVDLDYDGEDDDGKEMVDQVGIHCNTLDFEVNVFVVSNSNQINRNVSKILYHTSY